MSFFKLVAAAVATTTDIYDSVGSKLSSSTVKTQVTDLATELGSGIRTSGIEKEAVRTAEAVKGCDDAGKALTVAFKKSFRTALKGGLTAVEDERKAN
jgi:hypothetical protein